MQREHHRILNSNTSQKSPPTPPDPQPSPPPLLKNTAPPPPLTTPGDFPDVNRYREILAGYDLSALPKLKDKDLKVLDDTLNVDIPALVRQFDNPF